eukprot:6720223-Pyramimonas_sp.AAC.1
MATKTSATIEGQVRPEGIGSVVNIFDIMFRMVSSLGRHLRKLYGENLRTFNIGVDIRSACTTRSISARLQSAPFSATIEQTPNNNRHVDI